MTTKSTFRINKRILFWLLIGPALVLFAILMLYPLGNMFYVSMLDWRGLLRPSTFSGLENYQRLLEQDDFSVAVRNTFIHIGIALPMTIYPAFFIAFWLSFRPRGHRLLRIIFFSPAMIAPPGKALIFLGLYFPDGIINQMLTSVGLQNLTHVWLADPSTSLGAIIAIDVWGGIGFYAVLFYAMLSNIPAELYEAARIDGANEWTIMRKIAYPLLLDFVGVALMLHFMWLLLGSSQNVLLLTQGGPGNSSLTLGYYLYEQAFEVKRLGYSQAIGVVIFAIGIIGMFLIRRTTNRVYEF
ncbi:MAG: sugar ABC transporter permease [Aggregatilineales bacterium]